jgi:ubiquinone/menaquinone biosynthesis C-methylase UbiE/diadenosine tetraphosphate (Ap4A) HIT family hydrolase
MSAKSSSQQNNVATCEFCERLLADPQARKSRPWYDFNVILETENFVAVPALGSIVPGYLLIVSKRHIPSMAHLPERELPDLDMFLAQIVQTQAQHWGYPVIFEHGGCSDNRHSAGSCISHAHWHVVPGDRDLMPSNIKFTETISFRDFAQHYNRQLGYLFFQRGSKCFFAEVDVVRSQLFRRELARVVGEPDEWDYLAYPFLDNMRETIKLLDKSNLLRAEKVIENPTIRAYNASAPAYYSKTNTLHTYLGHKKNIDTFISGLNGNLVLDAGAGSCRDAAYFLERGLQVEAIDLAINLLLASSASCPNHIKRLMDIRHLAYADYTFDGIWCSAVLLHLDVEDIKRALKEFHRVLKPNGMLHVSLKEGEGEYKAFVSHAPELYRKFYLYTEEEVTGLMIQGGFTIKSVEVVQEIDSGGDYVDWIRCFAKA